MSESFVPRRYAVLRGATSQSIAMKRLCAAIETSDRHELVEPLGSSTNSVDADWRAFVEDEQIDAVIIAAYDEPALQIARQLAIHGKSLIVEASPSLPAEFVTEMSLYETEGTSQLRPWFAHRPLVDGVRNGINAASLGAITSLERERTIDLPAADDERFLTEQTFADIDLLRTLGGDYSQVTCLRTGGGDGAFGTQTLQLAGTDLPDATCIHRRTPSPVPEILRVVGTDDSAELTGDDDHLIWSVGGDEIDRWAAPPHKNASQDLLLHQLDSLWASEQPSSRWSDLVRIFDIGEAAERSLRRRRAIDLHFEATSERSQFKTHMATIGCGVILWTMFGMIGLLFAGAVLDPRDGMQREAEAASFVLREDEFTPTAPTLTEAGQQHVHQIANQMSLNESVVYIEAADGTDEAQRLNEDRRQEVWAALSNSGVEDSHRVVVRPIKGKWFAAMMQLARVLVFAPVGLFLLVQGLLAITKPAASAQ